MMKPLMQQMVFFFSNEYSLEYCFGERTNILYSPDVAQSLHSDPTVMFTWIVKKERANLTKGQALVLGT